MNKLDSFRYYVKFFKGWLRLKEREKMIIFIILVIVTVGLIIYGFYKYMVLNKEHQKMIDEHLDDIFEREKSKELLRQKIDRKNIEISKKEETINDLKKVQDNLKNEISSTIKECNLKIDSLMIQLETKDKLLIKESKKVQELENTLKEKNNKRIANIGIITSKQKKINNLENQIKKLKENQKIELDKKDDVIKFYKSKIPEPTIEELKAYDYSRREVEKRKKDEKRFK